MKFHLASELMSAWVGSPSVTTVMASIFSLLCGSLFIVGQSLQKKNTSANDEFSSTWFASSKSNLPKRRWEIFNLYYSIIWIFSFGIIIFFEVYKYMDEMGYMVVCSGLCIPIILFSLFCSSESETETPISERYATKAVLWMTIFSFIGNYWYTHYFYCVLEAKYTMPAWRLNNVPIQLYFATFFYFCFYHTLSNAAIRKAVTTFKDDFRKKIFLALLVLSMSYFTAFMETLTISAYPDYSFKDRDMAYIYGSAFYGIYFIVSFPMFYRFEERLEMDRGGRSKVSLLDTFVESSGAGMIILTMLDFVRLALGIALHIQ